MQCDSFTASTEPREHIFQTCRSSGFGRHFAVKTKVTDAKSIRTRSMELRRAPLQARRMGLDDRENCMSPPRTEAGGEPLEPGGLRDLDCKKWTSLKNYVDALVVAKPEIKEGVLWHLCNFLIASAATFKYSSPTADEEDVSLAAVVGDTQVFLSYGDLVALHELLFLELSLQVPLFGAETEIPSNLQVAALTLRCCIRLLPLIELFDTGLRNAMGVALDIVLQKLCSPTEPCLLPTRVLTTTEVLTFDIEPSRGPLLCALLEVFLDEFCCHSKSQLLLVQDEMSERGFLSKSRLTLEAILAHVMISAQAPQELHERRTQVCELSLQSAVILLDRVITDNAPRYLLSHVVRLVSHALEDATGTCEDLPKDQPKDQQQLPKDQEFKWFSRFPITGYGESRKIKANPVPDALSRQVSLWLVSSVLERGISLYMKFASAPHYANLVDDGPQPSTAVSNAVLASCLWNYVRYRGWLNQQCDAALESMLNDATLRKGLEECMDQTFCCDQGQETEPVLKRPGSADGNIERSSGTHCCGKGLVDVPVWEEDHSTLIADVLHLMHSALTFITNKVRPPEDSPGADLTREDIDVMWLGLIGSFHQCLPCAGEITAADSVGHVLVFFTDMLYYEAETTISDNRLREYLELLQSLLTTLLMEHSWRKSTSKPQESNGTVEVDPSREEVEISPSFYARKVVILLQGFLEGPELMEVLGDNAVSVILQISCFMSDFCEFMDKVLSTSDWRDDIPASDRRITKRTLKTVQEVDEVDRDLVREEFYHDRRFSEEQPSPDERRREDLYHDRRFSAGQPSPAERRREDLYHDRRFSEGQPSPGERRREDFYHDRCFSEGQPSSNERRREDFYHDRRFSEGQPSPGERRREDFYHDRCFSEGQPGPGERRREDLYHERRFFEDQPCLNGRRREDSYHDRRFSEDQPSPGVRRREDLYHDRRFSEGQPSPGERRREDFYHDRRFSEDQPCSNGRRREDLYHDRRFSEGQPSPGEIRREESYHDRRFSEDQLCSNGRRREDLYRDRRFSEDQPSRGERRREDLYYDRRFPEDQPCSSGRQYQPCPSHVERQPSQIGVGRFSEDQPCSNGRQYQPCPSHVDRQPSQSGDGDITENVNTKKLRPSTLPILQRLMKQRRRPTKPPDLSSKPPDVSSEPPDVTRKRKRASEEAEVTTAEGEVITPEAEVTPRVEPRRPIRNCRLKKGDLKTTTDIPTEAKGTDIPTEAEGTDIPTEAEGNAFVAEVLLLERTSENFDDLNDFIVCKQGRSYTRWLNRRTKFRRRKRNREIFKRSEEKQKLLSMLNIV